MTKQRSLASGTNARNFLQAGLANVFLAPHAMRAAGKAVSLVSQSFDEIEQRIARRQLEGRPAHHEKRFAPSIAVRTFCDRQKGDVGYAERRQRFLRCIELPLTSIDNQEVRPRLIMIFVSGARNMSHGAR